MKIETRFDIGTWVSFPVYEKAANTPAFSKKMTRHMVVGKITGITIDVKRKITIKYLLEIQGSDGKYLYDEYQLEGGLSLYKKGAVT